MKNKQHFYLLLEMNLLVPYQTGGILLQPADPDEQEKRKSGVVSEYSSVSEDYNGQHGVRTRFHSCSVPGPESSF
jgi:hypothetical protein